MWSYIRLQDCLKSIDYQFLPNGFNCVRSSTVCVTKSVEKEVVVYSYMVELVCSFHVLATGRDLKHSEVTWHRWLSVKKSKQDAQHYRTGCCQDGWGRVSKLFLQLASTTTTAAIRSFNPAGTSGFDNQYLNSVYPRICQMFITHSRSPNDTQYISVYWSMRHMWPTFNHLTTREEHKTVMRQNW